MGGLAICAVALAAAILAFRDGAAGHDGGPGRSGSAGREGGSGGGGSADPPAPARPADRPRPVPTGAAGSAGFAAGQGRPADDVLRFAGFPAPPAAGSPATTHHRWSRRALITAGSSVAVAWALSCMAMVAWGRAGVLLAGVLVAILAAAAAIDAYRRR
jgi:hypothetical protein